MSSSQLPYDVVLFTDFTDSLLLSKVLGAYKVAHVLRQQGHRVLTVDHFHAWRWDELKNLLDRVVSRETVAVCFSTTFFRDTSTTISSDHYNPQQYGAINFQKTFCPQGKAFEDDMVDHIRRLNADCKIVLGGHLASPNNQNRNVDYVITGHGEISMPDLISCLKQSRPLANTNRNVWGTQVHHSQEPNGHQFATGGMSWLEQDVFNARVLPIETARGCLFNCKFCSFPMRGKKNLDFVLQEELVYRELQDAYDRFGIDTWSVADDTFNDSDEKLDLILRAVRRLTFQPRFWCYARLDLMALRPHRINLMHEIGVRAVHFGIETLDHRAAKLVGKGMRPSRQIDTLQKLRAQWGDHFQMSGSFIVGLPGESLESVTRTYQRCRSQDIPLHTYSFLPLMIRYGWQWSSDFDINYQKYGFRAVEMKDGFINWKSDVTDWPTVKALAAGWNRDAQLDPNFRIPNRHIWSLLNLRENSFESLVTKRNIDLDLDDMGRAKNRYIQDYKRQITAWLGQAH